MKSEDVVYELIISRINEDLSFFNVFEFVRFEYLSSATISEFSRIVCEYFEGLNVSILCAICVHLTQNISSQTLNSRLKGTEIVLNLAAPLAGLISYSTREHGGNIHDRGIVTVTSSHLIRMRQEMTPIKPEHYTHDRFTRIRDRLQQCADKK
jgi:hypothetical protein